MNEKSCCVVDAQGFYCAYVLVQTDGDKQTVVGYTLQAGEVLVGSDTTPDRKQHAGGAGFVKPRWDEDAAAWIEGATAEELAAWEAEHPAPELPEPSDNLEERVAALEQAQAEIWSAQAAAIREGVNSVD